MLLDLSLLPAAYRVPVFVPAVPVSEKTKTGTVGMAGTLDLQGFQDAVPVVPAVPVTFAAVPQPPKTGTTGSESTRDTSQVPATLPVARRQPQRQDGPPHVSEHTAAIVTALATGQPLSAPSLPARLLSAIHLVARLEQWDADTVAESELFARRQIARGECSGDELAACYQAHLDRHHQGARP